MRRLIRHLKLGFFIVSLGTGVFLFSAFSHSPHVAMSFGEYFSQNIVNKQQWLPENLKASIQNALVKKSMDGEMTSEVSKPAEVNRAKGVETAQPGQDQEAKGSNGPSGMAGVTHYGGRDWVMIQGKYYLYNPKNIYWVDGVTTYFKPDIYKPEGVAEKKQVLVDVQKPPDPQLAQADEPAAPQIPVLDAAKTVLHGYSPQGMQELKQNLQKIQEGMKARNDALRALQNEK